MARSQPSRVAVHALRANTAGKQSTGSIIERIKEASGIAASSGWANAAIITHARVIEPEVFALSASDGAPITVRGLTKRQDVRERGWPSLGGRAAPAHGDGASSTLASGHHGGGSLRTKAGTPKSRRLAPARSAELAATTPARRPAREPCLSRAIGPIFSQSSSRLPRTWALQPIGCGELSG